MRYGDLPASLGLIDIPVAEMMFYQDMPIKLSGETEFAIEARLKVFGDLVGQVSCDFVGSFGLSAFVDHYVYIVAKHLYQPACASINRPGYHTDGFGTDDITYIWTNAVPTVFNSTRFELSDDDKISMQQMDEQADPSNEVRYRESEILRLNRFNVHRPAMDGDAGLRAFVKVIFSRDKFALIGNTKNPLLSYNWPNKPRDILRNVPQGAQ